jgi:farnesyl diphosphate synthase/geranylgeranyl diphosphate synthase type II
MTDALASQALTGFLARQREQTNRLLHEVAASLPANQVGDAMRYALNGDGKRLRPALCVAVYHALDGTASAIQRLAAAIEIIHTYSLVHDDLPCMDDDDVRRGRQTTHRVYGNEAALLAGAALIPLAFRTADEALGAMQLSAPRRQEIHATLARAAGAGGMVGGQVLDLEGSANVTDAAQLERIHAAKTGALITAACLLGALAANASASMLEAMERYAQHLGLAFQITDDVLDETASTAELGKTAGKDREGAKATYPAVLGLDGARQRARAEADSAVAALRGAGLNDVLLNDLALFAVERRR